jgi:hypothetical protein
VGIVAFLVMKMLINLQGKEQLHHYSAIKNWIECQHRTTCNNLPGHRHDKLFISGPCKKRAEHLLKLSRHQLRLVVALLIGHAPVRKHLNIMGL